MDISIIIPYKKDRGYLKAAIDSANFQDFEGDWEIIESQSEAGVCHNINEGFKISSGDLVRFLCDDDMLNPQSLRHTFEYFKNNPGIDFFHSHSEIADANGDVKSIHIPRHTPKTAKELAGKNYIHGGTVVYRRKCFEAEKWNEDLWTGEEYEYNMRLLSKGFKLGYLPEVTYIYRRHGQQKSARRNRNHSRRVEAIKRIKAMYR